MPPRGLFIYSIFYGRNATVYEFKSWAISSLFVKQTIYAKPVTERGSNVTSNWTFIFQKIILLLYRKYFVKLKPTRIQSEAGMHLLYSPSRCLATTRRHPALLADYDIINNVTVTSPYSNNKPRPYSHLILYNKPLSTIVNILLTECNQILEVTNEIIVVCLSYLLLNLLYECLSG